MSLFIYVLNIIIIHILGRNQLAVYSMSHQCINQGCNELFDHRMQLYRQKQICKYPPSSTVQKTLKERFHFGNNCYNCLSCKKQLKQDNNLKRHLKTSKGPL